MALVETSRRETTTTQGYPNVLFLLDRAGWLSEATWMTLGRKANWAQLACGGGRRVSLSARWPHEHQRMT